MAEDEAEAAPTATVSRYRGKTNANCARCSNSYRAVPAEWTLKVKGQKLQHLCETHARYWAAQYGIDTFPADK